MSPEPNQPSDFDAQTELLKLLATRRGHFLFESGHHGNLWLDLEPMFLRPKLVRPLAEQLARRLARYNIAAVCGPLSGGAFIAQLVATALDVEFYFTEPAFGPERDGLFPVKYRLPSPMRASIAGKRVAIANDVINAGSAVRGTYQDLKSCSAEPIVVGTLAILGTCALSYFAERGVALESLAQLPNELWLPQECPLCASGEPLDKPQETSAQGAENCEPG